MQTREWVSSSGAERKRGVFRQRELSLAAEKEKSNGREIFSGEEKQRSSSGKKERCLAA
jgi:hypothetical protein